MEHPHALMNPQSEDSQLWIAIEFIEDVDTLDNFADISHVEHVMRFGRCRQKVISYGIVQIDSGIGKCLWNLFDLIIEILSKEFVW